jgi:cytochrome c oxidase subunit 1
MPRRVYTYLPESGWGTLNFVATVGAGLLGFGAVLFVVNVVMSLRAGAFAGDDPWAADGLEWSTPSPPPPYNFLYLPTVNGRYPLWTRAPHDPVIVGLRSDVREVLITNAIDADPDHRHSLDGPTIWPFCTAVSASITFIGVVFTPWALVVGGALTFIALAAWFWPLGVPVSDTAREALS